MNHRVSQGELNCFSRERMTEIRGGGLPFFDRSNSLPLRREPAWNSELLDKLRQLGPIPSPIPDPGPIVPN